MQFFLFSILLSEGDTTRVFTIREIVVTGNRSPVAIEKLASSVQVVDSALLAQSNGFSVADVVRNSAGVFLQNYGGNGALQSISIRGMGSEYSLILVNGQRYTSYQISTVDLGIFSLMDVERIEIASGGNSSLYGADAVGGVVNIITKKPSGKIQASVAGSIGSFGMSGCQMSVGGGDEQLSLRGSVRMENARNDFNFNFNDGVTNQVLRRDGADYSVKNYSLSSSAIVSRNTFANVSVRHSDAERGQPSAVTSISQNNLARIHDNDVFSAAAIEIQQSQNLRYSLPFSFHYNHQTYSDPNLFIGHSSVSSYYRNRTANFTPVATFLISEGNHIVTGIDAAFASLASNELKTSTRTQLSGFVSSEHHFYIPLEIIVYPSLRYDSFSDTKGDVSPKIGANIGILNKPVLRIRSSYGKNYRVPTFNDLYWLQGGNPNLQPERSLSFDAGVLLGIELLGKIKIEANYFSIQAKDKIVWQPGISGIWSPKNLQSVSSRGIELSASARLWDEALCIRYTGNYVQALKTSADFPNDMTQNKYLVYLPQQTSSLTVGSSMQNISAALTYSFTGFRFLSQDNDPRFIFPAFEKVDANVSYRLAVKQIVCKLKGEVNNLFNEKYQLIAGYPMPMRNVMVTTEFTIQ
jgi:outer membrane cobalamin receptor